MGGSGASFPHGLNRGHTGTCPLTRLITAVSGGHASVDKDFATDGGIPSGNVQARLLEFTGAGCDAVPGGNTLLGDSRIPCDAPMEASSEIPKGIVTNATERPHSTPERVLATAIKRLTTHLTVLVPMVTNGTLRTDR